MTINIAVLITCHNRKHKTIKCLEYLFKQKKIKDINIKVFLVDDASTDGTKKSIENLFPLVKIIRGNGNLFWGKGIALAWEKSLKYKKKFNYYLWLNDDTYLFPDAIKNLLMCKNIVSSDEFISVGSTCDDNLKKRTYGGFINLKNKIRVFKNKIVYPNKNFQFIHGFNGNIVLIPHKAFIKIGKFDKSLTHYFGDIDYSIRAFKKNIPILLAPNFIGICNADKKIINIDNLFLNKEIVKTGWIFCKKHGKGLWILHFISLILSYLK